ncbi:hypothetical protein DICA1_B12024 [Diutina catenulata]
MHLPLLLTPSEQTPRTDTHSHYYPTSPATPRTQSIPCFKCQCSSRLGNLVICDRGQRHLTCNSCGGCLIRCSSPPSQSSQSASASPSSAPPPRPRLQALINDDVSPSSSHSSYHEYHPVAPRMSSSHTAPTISRTSPTFRRHNSWANPRSTHT